MSYRIAGLDPGQFQPYFKMDAGELAAHRAERTVAKASTGFPCRISLRDADEGEELLLINHVNHAVETPYRNAFAIFVRKNAVAAATFFNECPPVFAGRPIALRGYSGDGMLVAARLALPGQADTLVRELLEDNAIAYLDAHNAAHGCFSARIERHDD